ncbi:tyrosine-type recombinase/integrase [Maribellus comscasis]|uniref:Tyrosine-type recombinase/integrase n=1 Tax=Maribellus comscasis TaxID=2681766 RepID=A0A6I6JPF9_9BACT|nr:site-specific integrase [Maribellus comscasis]QGY44855.1 tyrosine-type recombinase/integrase [Maribellus comscasis]
MASNVKIILDTRRQKSDQTYPLILRFIHNRKSVSMPLGYSMQETDWDTDKCIVLKSYKGVSNISRLNNWIQKQRVNAMDIINKLQDTGEIDRMSITEIKSRIVHNRSSVTFFDFTDEIIEELTSAKRLGYAQSVRSVLTLVKKYRKDKDFPFEEMTHKFLVSFENYCRGKGNTTNSIAVYMKTIKMVYNRAIKAGIVQRDMYPFVNYTIRLTKTRKRAVQGDVIRKIEALELPMGSRLWHSKNYFLFSFYTMGINFADMAQLKGKNIVDGRIEYTRQKTKKEYSIKITAPMQRILDLYAQGKNEDDYIFPIITRIGDPVLEFKDVAEKRRINNKKLKEIGEMLGMTTPLTSYVARHSWATIAKRKGVPVAIISEGMGHEDVKTTEIYLDSFEQDVLDEYNEMITG